MNRFDTFKTKAKPQPKKGGAKKAADAEADGSAPQQKQSLGKGFQAVEVKQNKRTKPKEKTEAQLAAMNQPKAAKPIKKAWGNAPVGCVMVDLEEEKAEQKRIQSLKKHLAKQVVKPTRGEAIQKVPEKKEEAEEQSEEQKPAKEVQRLVGGWGDAAPAQKAAARKPGTYVDPAAVTAANLQLQQENKKKKSSVKVTIQSKKKAAPVSKETKVTKNVDHTHLEDGSVVADVVFTLITKNGKAIPLKDGAHAALISQTMVDTILRKEPLKAGMFISAELHQFSGKDTVDQPWMIDSLYKAVLKVASGDKPQASAYTYWRKEGKESVEGAVTVKKFSDTALQLDNEASARATTKSLRVHREEFLKSLVENGTAIVGIVDEVMAELANAPNADQKMAEWSTMLPQHLKATVEELNALLGQ